MNPCKECGLTWSSRLAAEECAEQDRIESLRQRQAFKHLADKQHANNFERTEN